MKSDIQWSAAYGTHLEPGCWTAAIGSGLRAGFDRVQPVLRGLRQRTQADYCRREAVGAAGAVDEPWVLLAMAWAKLALETKARSQLN